MPEDQKVSGNGPSVRAYQISGKFKKKLKRCLKKMNDAQNRTEQLITVVFSTKNALITDKFTCQNVTYT